MVNNCYDDILFRIAAEPVWFDEHAAPRYCEFSPNKVANIYANEAALVEVTCQHCRRLFRVAFSAAAKLSEWPAGPIGIKIREQTLRYGDPPNVGCCEAGPSMNSEPRKVVEYWREGDPAYTHVEAIGRTITTLKPISLGPNIPCSKLISVPTGLIDDACPHFGTTRKCRNEGVFPELGVDRLCNPPAGHTRP